MRSADVHPEVAGGVVRRGGDGWQEWRGAKDKKPNLTLLHDHLTDWSLRQRGLPGPIGQSLLQSVIKGNSDFLRQATDEVLAYLQWLNRFAEAEGMRDDTAD